MLLPLDDLYVQYITMLNTNVGLTRLMISLFRENYRAEVSQNESRISFLEQSQNRLMIYHATFLCE